eukprot:2148826-Prymnesium_polylepis.2
MVITADAETASNRHCACFAPRSSGRRAQNDYRHGAVASPCRNCVGGHAAAGPQPQRREHAECAPGGAQAMPFPVGLKST